MKLAGRQLVLDTNVLLYLLRGNATGQLIESRYAVGQRSPRAIISVVTKGEMKALAYKLGWESKRRERLSLMLASLPVADIANDAVIDAYAMIDHASATAGVTMGKNDLWIAATTHVLGGVLLTADRDFEHLESSLVQVERIALSASGTGKT